MGLKSWQTPDWVIEAIESDVLKFTIDVAATRENAKCKRFISELENALIIPKWGEGGELAWCNPPYINIDAWIKKAAYEFENHHTRTIMLLPSSTGSKWFHTLPGFCDIGFIQSRIAFVHPFEPDKQRPMHDNIIATFGHFNMGEGKAHTIADRISLAIQDRKKERRAA